MIIIVLAFIFIVLRYNAIEYLRESRFSDVWILELVSKLCIILSLPLSCFISSNGLWILGGCSIGLIISLVINIQKIKRIDSFDAGECVFQEIEYYVAMIVLMAVGLYLGSRLELNPDNFL